MRLGDLDALKEVIETYRPIPITSDYLQGKNNMIDYCIAEIDNAPTIEPFEKIGAICNENCGYNTQGEWIAGERNGEGYDYYCSRCMQITLEDINRINFCPKCGAKMR